MLLDELDSFVTKELGVTLKEYRYINIGGKMVYLEGQSGILNLTREEISFKVRKKVCSIKGSDLYVKYYDNSTALVCGSIVSVVVL
ncbi:MAG: YabP/YqfC family sporulation protein [Clostridia bacterium]